jgi:spore coat protein CotF
MNTMPNHSGSTPFAEKERMTDSLNSQKQMTGIYNLSLNESATPELIRCLTGLWEEEQRIAGELFQEMSKRGWYPTEPADAAKVQAARQQYGQKTTV